MWTEPQQPRSWSNWLSDRVGHLPLRHAQTMAGAVSGAAAPDTADNSQRQDERSRGSAKSTHWRTRGASCWACPKTACKGSDDRLILVDVGTGELYGPTLNKLPASLKAAGYTPEQITDILVTHIHTDHTGGLMDGSTRVFPNATIHVDRRELDYWLSPANLAQAPAAKKPTFMEAQTKVGPSVAAGKVQAFDGATELFPGIRSVPA